MSGSIARKPPGDVTRLLNRLQQGDIWPGDIIDLSVSGETKWVGQFSVSPNRQLELEDIDPVSMSSFARSLKLRAAMRSASS